jgi:hypothetical protein
MIEAASTPETMVNFYRSTLHYNPEDIHLHAHRRENFKSYTQKLRASPLSAWNEVQLTTSNV